MRNSDDQSALPGGAGDSGCCQMPGGWFFPGILVAILVGLFFLGTMLRKPDIDTQTGSRRQPSDVHSAGEIAPSAIPEGETVSLSVDFGNGVTRGFAALSWREEMTVADLMRMAAQFRPGLIFSQSGEGEMAFLTAIDGVPAEGNDGRNWIVYVGGERCQTGIGARQLEPGDAVLWKYEPYE